VNKFIHIEISPSLSTLVGDISKGTTIGHGTFGSGSFSRKNNELIKNLYDIVPVMEVSREKTMKLSGMDMIAAMLSFQVALLARFYWTGHHVPANYCDNLIGARHICND